MPDAQTGNGVPLSHYTGVLRRRWWAIVFCALLGPGIAATYLLLVPQQATATTTVSVNIITNDPFNPSRSAAGLIDLASEAQIASSSLVAERVAAQVGGDISTSDVRRAVDVAGVAETSILRVSATAASESGARSIADTVAQEYLAYRSEQAQSRIDRAVDGSRERLIVLRDELSAANEALRAATAAEDVDAVTQAETDRSLITAEINSLSEQVASTQAIDTAAGSVLNPASRNAVDWSPPRNLVLLTGLLVGIGVGVLLAFALSALGTRVRSEKDVERSGGRTVLGELSGKQAQMPPEGRDLEELRATRERMLADSRFSLQSSVCAVIDETGSGAAADVPLNLAFVMAQTGLTVEFVGVGGDNDLLRHAIQALSLQPDPESRIGHRYLSKTYPNLSVFIPPAGEDQGEPISQAVRAELAARRDSGLLLVGVPPETSEATRLAACRLSDVVVLAAAGRGTRMAQMQRTAQDVRLMGGHLMGTILVGRYRSLTFAKHESGASATSPAAARSSS